MEALPLTRSLRPSWIDLAKLAAVGCFLLVFGALLLILFPLFIISVFFLGNRILITSFKYLSALKRGEAAPFWQIELPAQEPTTPPSRTPLHELSERS